jgi:hypothetical protein
VPPRPPAPPRLPLGPPVPEETKHSIGHRATRPGEAGRKLLAVAKRSGTGEHEPAGEPAPVLKRVITIVPSPGRAEIWLDGTAQPPFNPGHNTIELTWDRDHTLEFRNDCCPPVVKQLGPTLPPPTDDRLIVKFEGKVAELSVTTDPAAEGGIGVNELDPPAGRKPFVTGGKLGETIPISFEGDSDMVKTLQLTIDADGRPPKNVRRIIHAGEKLPVMIPLGE